MKDQRLEPGLYIVGTPIGNLEDITLRALRVLREADRIACEDTRQTQKLLNHFDIRTPTVSYHEHNEAARAAELMVHLQKGECIALVTDAGMPAVSDPGFRLIALAVQNGVRVVPIPGASAFLSALVASGVPADNFHFSGFLPAKAGQRRKQLESLAHSDATQIFYEAPHRILETLKDVVDVLGPRRYVVVAREVTKLHEEFLRGSADDVLRTATERGELKGEITLLIARADEGEAKPETRESVSQKVERLMKEESLDERDALKRIAREMGISKSEAYRELQRTKK